MSNPNAHDIKVLNGLIETTLDSADGYREAAKETDQTRYRGLFEQRAEERGRVAADAQIDNEARAQTHHEADKHQPVQGEAARLRFGHEFLKFNARRQRIGRP